VLRASLFVVLTACGGAGGAADAAGEADAGRADGAVEDAAEVDGPVPADADAHDAPAMDAALPPDAPPDAMPVQIAVVPCASAMIAVEVSTSVTDYFPSTMTIQLGEVIRFAPNDPHDVMAGTPAAPQPTWFAVAGNDPQCLRFDEPGAFPFFCTAHPSSMTGSVTVTAAGG
jgi:plastocyanin